MQSCVSGQMCVRKMSEMAQIMAPNVNYVHRDPRLFHTALPAFGGCSPVACTGNSGTVMLPCTPTSTSLHLHSATVAVGKSSHHSAGMMLQVIVGFFCSLFHEYHYLWGVCIWLPSQKKHAHITSSPRLVQHSYYIFESVHDSNVDDVIRIFLYLP